MDSLTCRPAYLVSCPFPWLSGHGVILGGFWYAQLRLTRRLARSVCTDVPFQYGEEEAEKKLKLLWGSWLQKFALLSILYKDEYIGHSGMPLNFMKKYVCDVLKCNILTTLAIGTDLRIRTVHTAIFIVLENVRGFKSPQVSISEHWRGSIGNLSCYWLLDFSV